MNYEICFFIIVFIYFSIPIFNYVILTNKSAEEPLTKKINIFARIIDLSEDYKSPALTSIRELKLFIDEITPKKYSVNFNTTFEEITFHFMKLSGNIKFKIYEGPSTALTKDEDTIFLDNIDLNYTLKIDYSTGHLEYKNASFKIIYNDSKILELNNEINKGDEYIQKTINISFQNKLEIMPFIISKTMKDTFEKHPIIFNCIYYYSKLNHIIVALIDYILILIKYIINFILRKCRIIN